MNKANGKFCTWYLCPNCNAPNLVLTPPKDGEVCCSRCHRKHLMAGLLIHYLVDGKGELTNDTSKICMAAVRFHCNCGHANLIIPRVEVVKQLVANEQPNFGKQGVSMVVHGLHDKTYFLHYETPLYGLCEECMSDYELVYRSLSYGDS